MTLRRRSKVVRMTSATLDDADGDGGIDMDAAPPSSLSMTPTDVHAPTMDQPTDKKKPMRRPRKGGLKMRLEIAGGHAIEVRHSKDREFVARNFDHLDLSDKGDVVKSEDGVEMKWIQLAKLGSFKGHVSGPFELTSSIFDDIIRNFKEVDDSEVVFDYEHQSEEIPPVRAPASGWIRQLQNRGPAGLWGLVEWTEPARQHILAKEYKKVSPAIRFNARHPTTGKAIGPRLSSSALTNQPFLRQMAPVAAKDTAGKTGFSLSDLLARARSAMCMSPLSVPSEIKAEVIRLRSHYEAIDETNPDALWAQNKFGVGLGRYTDELLDMGSMLGSPTTMGDLLDTLETKIAEAEQDSERQPPQENGKPGLGETPIAATSREEIDMDQKEFDKKLADEKARADKAEADLTALKAKEAELTLQLRESSATATLTSKRLEALEKLETERETESINREVSDAIIAYGSTKGITAADRDTLVTLRQANKGAFQKLYPPVADITQAARSALLFADNGGALAASPAGHPAIEPGAPQGPTTAAEPVDPDAHLDGAGLVDIYQKRDGMSLRDAALKAGDVERRRHGQTDEVPQPQSIVRDAGRMQAARAKHGF